jgi:hypothetical protein
LLELADAACTISTSPDATATGNPEDRKMTREDNSHERMCYRYAADSQGYTGTYAEWLAMGEVERSEYEVGAAGIPTG